MVVLSHEAGGAGGAEQPLASPRERKETSTAANLRSVRLFPCVFVDDRQKRLDLGTRPFFFFFLAGTPSHAFPLPCLHVLTVRAIGEKDPIG